MKGLERVPAEAKESRQGSASSKDACGMLEHLEDMYARHGGNLRDIFDDLGENPGKALKYPPRDAREFATKYLEGGYTYVPGKAASSPGAKGAK